MIVLNRCKWLATNFIVLLGFLFHSSAVFPSQDVEDNGGSESQEIVVIEEITVRVPRSFYSLRFQLKEAEKKLYSTYNEVNVDDDNDVNCKKSDWTSTHIIEQVCWPVFFEKLVGEHTQRVMYGEELPLTVPQLRRDAEKEFAALREHMQMVAFENPSVAKALVEFGTLEQTYRRKRAECMKKPAVLFLFRKCP